MKLFKALLLTLLIPVLFVAPLNSQWQIGNRYFGHVSTWTHRASQGANNASATGVTTLTVTLASNPTTSDLVVCGLAFSSSISALTFKDSASTPNSYTKTSGSPHHGMVYSYAFYLLSAPSTANKTLTASWTTSSAVLISCDEFVNSNPGHQTYDSTSGDAFRSTGTASGTNINLPSCTPSTGGELAYGFVLDASGTITAPTSGSALGVWTGSDINANGSGSEYDLSVSSATAANY